MNKIDENVFGNMIESLADAFKKERHEDQPYKELFKAGSTHTGLLRELETKMARHVVDACDVYEERLGIKINKNQYNLLLALPLLAKIAENDAKKNEGLACCVDKAYYILSEQIKSLSDDNRVSDKK